MSKPNLIGFSTAVGFYRNDRVRDLHDLLKKAIPRKVDFAELAPMLFQVAMSAAAENQTDGDFSRLSRERWAEIFITNFVNVSVAEAALIRERFETVGLFDHGKIRSWKKYNRHLADYDGLVKAKRLAGKLSAKKRQMEARAALKNGEIPREELDDEPEKNAAQNDSPSKQLWLIEKALESAKGPAKKELLERKRALLAESTGVDLDDPPPPPALPAARPRKQDPADFGRIVLKNARLLVEEGNAELMTEAMVKALHAAGDELPEEARRKFPKLVAELGEARNPVPG